MIYNIRHRTTYTYDAPLSFVRCVLRLTPRSDVGQTLLSSGVEITPTPTGAMTRAGPFGEAVQTVVIETEHEALVIDARSRVDVHPAPIDAQSPDPAWESVRARSFKSGDLGPESPAAFVYPTARTPILPQITDYARPSFAPGRPVMAAGIELMQRIHADFVFDSKATDVSTPIAEAFAARAGVCQDFSHIMVAALRGLGLPAAYVSGYLRTIPPPGRPRLEGADASHAWVRLWCGPDRGWVGLDPTNAILALEDHITLGVGRDYSDMAPVDCIMFGSGGQTLKVEVDVIQI